MRPIFRIARTELAVLFYSPIAWFILIVFALLTTMKFTGSLDSSITLFDLGFVNDYSFTATFFGGMTGFFVNIQQNLYIYIPLLTMGLMSREYASGSAKLLYSSPITSRQIILGKYLATMIYGLVLLIVPVLCVIYLGCFTPHFDWPLVLTGLLGLYLIICAYSAIGLFMSSITSYQVVAAVGTLTTLAVLTFIGRVGQEYDFVRELTYWLSISGRASQMISGLICSEDIIYFMAVVFLFISLSILRLFFSRTTYHAGVKALGYTSIVVVVLTIGYISSRPRWMSFYDATATKTQTITPQSQKIVGMLDGKLTITSYVNMLDHGFHTPMHIKTDQEIFKHFVRFKPDTKLIYVYYWDSIDDPSLYERHKGKSEKEIVEYLAGFYKLSMSRIKTPEEIRQIVDLSAERNRFVRVIEWEHGKKRAFLRDYNDNVRNPSETEISAALKKMVMPSPVIGFLTGQGERDIKKAGDRDYSIFAENLYFRHSLVNQGFDVHIVDLNLYAQIPPEITILVIAECRTPLSAQAMGKIDHYIAGGGNLLIMADVERQSVMNPLLQQIGIQMEDGFLAQPTKDFYPSLILSQPTDEAASLSEGFKEMLKTDGRVSMPGAVALSYNDTKGYHIIPLLSTRDTLAWIELETKDLTDNKLVLNPAAGEVEGRYITALAASRMLDGKEQRILVMGDADCMSNAELTIQREGYNSSNFSLIVESFRWLSYGEFPVNTKRPPCPDNKLKLTYESMDISSLLFFVVIPGIMLLSAIMLLLRRRKQ